MKGFVLSAVTLVSFLCSAPAGAQWLENFNAYTPGFLSPQSNWNTYNAGFDAEVVVAPFFTGPHSAEVGGSADVAHDIAATPLGQQPSSGQWILSCKVYAESAAAGNGWFKVFNQFPSSPTYAVKVTFDLDANFVKDSASKKSVPLKYGEWVSFIVWLDLDNDVYHMYYGDQLLASNLSWTSSFSPNGPAILAGIELQGFANLSEIYFDDLRLEPGFGDVVTLVSSPNPVSSGASLTFTSRSLSLGAGNLGALFTWSVNGFGFYQPLFFPVYDATGSWSLTAPVPAGLSGLQVGFKAMAVPSSGPLMLSNEDVVIFL